MSSAGLTFSFAKQLDELKQQQVKLNREKVDLENQLEAEQEYIVNKLQKQVDRLAKEKAALQQEKADLQRHVRSPSQAQLPFWPEDRLQWPSMETTTKHRCVAGDGAGCLSRAAAQGQDTFRG